ncbi:Do family serine endopeptidase [Lysobacter solisilvae (ex Woo and Kim 2020)]|uniref:Probable periplasmic serine endoprotease DegP-like n=1 Tax=Agrilutibacter terrestris TaxID=2865112 RepID=A0A7H0FY89_9GAMM|nr:Do family serine endopeptidase [Lysobacter terrestris]QNP41005.1 Do family serine endopeptidase [Lysobacter terrestris]
MNRPLRSLAVLGVIAASLPTACTAQPPAVGASVPAATTAQTVPASPVVTGLPDFTNLVQQVAPAVVNVSAEVGARRVARGGDADEEQIPEFFRRMLPPGMFEGPGGPQAPQAPRGVSMGTGFLISNDGYVLTNHHVVEGADTVTVKLSDRREFKAKVVGSDQQSDVALLKIDGKGLPALRLGDSTRLKPGQWVVAIGSPFGLDQSVTAGIVSAVGRANPYADQRYVPFIQTDVAINRGNSGGPLLNTSGEVVGINSQIFSNSGGYMGVSFAIPIDVAMSAADQIKQTGKVSRGQLGVQVQAISAEDARGLGLPDAGGALVSVVVPGSAAAKAGIERADVIRAVNGRAVNVSSDLPPLIGGMPPGTKVRLEILRDGKPRQVQVTLDALNEELAGGAVDQPGSDDEDAPSGSTARGNPLGLAGRDLSAAERQQLGLQASEGVRLARVGDAAAGAGLRAGDVVLSVGRTSVGTAAALDRALAGVKDGQTVMLLVRRGNATQFIAVTAGEDEAAG